MKRLTLLFIFVISLTGIYAQKIITTETLGIFGKDSRNAIKTNVFYTDVKDVEAGLNKLIKNYKGKVSKKKGVIFGDDLIIATISNNPIDIYATVKKIKDSDEVEVIVAFDLGVEYLYSTKYPEQFQRASQILKDFALSLTENSHANSIKNQEKVLAKKQKTYDKLVKEKEKTKKQNEDYNKRIVDNEKKIKKYEQDINAQEIDINDYKRSLNDAKKDAVGY